MRLASFRHKNREGVGIVVDDKLLDVRTVAPHAPTHMRGLLEFLNDEPDALAAVSPSPLGGIALSDVELLPVVTDPQAIWCAALTYLSHVQEAPNRRVPEYPLFFLRVPNSQMGHRAAMLIPTVSNELDYEGELAVIIGRAGRHIPRENAHAYIAGFSCYNDGSVRDWQRHTSQITPGKNFAGTGGFGPWLVTPDEFGDPYARSMSTRVNGEVVQSAAISELLFPIDYMINYLSTICRLEVGDVIVTGTCGGVGARRQPPAYLKSGDEVEVEIDGIGILSNLVVSEDQ